MPFQNSDFDFWIAPNRRYVPVLKGKLREFATIVKDRLPEDIKLEYSFVKTGRIILSGEDERFAWVAIKTPQNRNDIFNQCNFTIEVSKDALSANAVIRNGRTNQPTTAIGRFAYQLLTNPETFLRVIKGISVNKARLVISRRSPMTGNRLMPGNEKWSRFFDIRLNEITDRKDIYYLLEILRKADSAPGAPGIHFKHSIERGSGILSAQETLINNIVSVITKFKPLLDYLKSGRE